jgi:nucleoside-diphosphate-sugar epimerase
MQKTIVLAGATGNLGEQICQELISNGAKVKAIVRHGADTNKLNILANKGVEISQLDFNDFEALKIALIGADCIVSALAGLKDVIIDLQTKIAEAAIAANVPRFIPSDFCTDFTALVPGGNRNLDTRRNFHDYINTQNIKPTSVFNGAFMELITGPMPLILFKQKRILCWGNPNIKMDFTHTKNVAEFTAKAALDDNSPRYLKIAGESITAKETADLITKLSKNEFKMLKLGGISLFNILIKITKIFTPQPNELYPPWQGMQYMRDMMEGKAAVNKHDNNKYSIANWIGFEKHLLREKYS